MILETHGGTGRLWARCYSHVAHGIVFESDSEKASHLARQRPAWAVYQADCEKALASAVGDHLPVNFLDLDPWGSPWPTIGAFFAGIKPTVERLVVVVHDGLRNRLRMNMGWRTGGLEAVVERIGNQDCFANYKEICRDLMKEKAAESGYQLSRWAAFYTAIDRKHGDLGVLSGQDSTHYAAVLTKC
ncbi:MAG: hypothetical protein A2Z18_11135 [Armatimonadetes bacterium RBG_16_58_9]|nr:MAG: hypothetical protein A2Z18_11135 [Armatimonadetes bacterium RBG_16_58_9]